MSNAPVFDKALLAARQGIANAANRLSRTAAQGGRAPILSAQTSRDVLIDWLVWADPNGAHTDAQVAVEDIEPYTLVTAWTAVEQMLTDFM